MRDRYETFTAKNAEVAAIGMGTREAAADFRGARRIPFPLLVDNAKETYRIAQMKRGRLLDVVGPRVWRPGIKSIRAAGLGTLPKQDAYQIGGAMVVRPGGSVAFVHRGQTAADNADVEKLLDAIE